MTNIYYPQLPSCPTHGQHNRWLTSHTLNTEKLGLIQSFQLCGLCVIDGLRKVGYTITEPEEAESGNWIMDEIPEKP